MKDLFDASTFPSDFGSGITNEEDLLSIYQSKGNNYSSEIRSIVYKSLMDQNNDLNEEEKANLEAFGNGACTITTGHQLMVCGGTAFFEVKILSTVALAKQAQQICGQPVVPIFWMASEDHDFEEIASFRVNSQKFTWKNEHASGAVGRLRTKDLAMQLTRFEKNAKLSESQRSFIKKRIKAYQESDSLAEATRRIVREWCGDFGVLVIDGDDSSLKKVGQKIWSMELNGALSSLIQERTNEMVNLGYKAQVTPRPINLFELKAGSRERIMKPKKIQTEHISPNALIRPVYQETLLPNLAYVGGGAELAYWLQLGKVFDFLAIPMPKLYLRDSLVVGTEKTDSCLQKNKLEWKDILSGSRELLIKRHLEYDKIRSFETEQFSKPLKEAISLWEQKMLESYPEMKSHTEALKRKMDNLASKTIEHRYRAHKRRNHDFLNRLNLVFDKVYPDDIFWERSSSYADAVGILGHDPKDFLVEKMSTIKAGTHILLG
jgi:uncharacterized protein YllA (UPF0747 family)